MTRKPLEQAFEVCQKSKTTWLNGKASLAKAEMALKEFQLTSHNPNPEKLQALRDTADLRKWEVHQSARCYIHAHEAVQRISIRRHLHAFMQKNGTALAAALAPELMYLDAQPEMVRERTLDRAAASIREALSVHLAGGAEVDYAEEDREILTAIGFRPDRASREDNRAKYSPEQSQIFMRRMTAQSRKKSA